MLSNVPLDRRLRLLSLATIALLYNTVISFLAIASMSFLIKISNNVVPLGRPPKFLTGVSSLEEAVV